MEHDNYPISFYNRKYKEFQGISVEVLNDISALTGIYFEPIASTKTTWTEIMEKLKNGEVFLVTELIYSETSLLT